MDEKRNLKGVRRFAADELKRDREIVLTAVRRSGLCLEFAAPEMRADRDVVLAAVQVQGEALEFASEALRGDPLVVAEAIRSSATVDFRCSWPFASGFQAADGPCSTPRRSHEASSLLGIGLGDAWQSCGGAERPEREWLDAGAFDREAPRFFWLLKLFSGGR